MSFNNSLNCGKKKPNLNQCILSHTCGHGLRRIQRFIFFDRGDSVDDELVVELVEEIDEEDDDRNRFC